jgi:hypothetical protein
MPLLQNTLNAALENAFDKAMLTFKQTIEASPKPGVDIAARKAAAKVFASIATPAIDAYIKSATIIIQPGQVVTTPAGPGATSSPSSPATIN